MKHIKRVAAQGSVFDVRSDWSIAPRATKPGPPERIDGMSLGVITTDQDAPHGGEVHPDGDEWLYVISGRLQVVGDSAPDAPITLAAGEACIVPAGEWHKVRVLELTQFIHLTPGPNGDHRPLD